MSFSSRRRNYLLTPHRRDGLIEWMKEMLMHSFVLDALDATGADTFSHFEMLVEEHRLWTATTAEDKDNDNNNNGKHPSRLRQLVPTVGNFFTRLPLRKAFQAYNAKYALTSRKHVCISFNEIRHILNLAQIMASHAGDDDDRENDNDSPQRRRLHEHDERAAQRWSSANESLFLLQETTDTTTHNVVVVPSPLTSLEEEDAPSSAVPTTPPHDDQQQQRPPPPFPGPRMISFDGDQTLYSDGANFESNPQLATYLYLLLRHGVTVAVVTAAGYEYQSDRYELRLSGLLAFFRDMKLPATDCARFYLFGGECNYLLNLGPDYKLHAVKEYGPGGWITATTHLPESPANWNAAAVSNMLDTAERIFSDSRQEQKLRARVLRKKRSVGLIPESAQVVVPREALDETVLRAQNALNNDHHNKLLLPLPFCAFNGGRDVWVDVGNKRVGVEVLQSYLGIRPADTLHIGDQFLNTGNDYAARDVCPCVWITCPEETTYILKSVLRLGGKSLFPRAGDGGEDGNHDDDNVLLSPRVEEKDQLKVNFDEMNRRSSAVSLMDVYTGEMRTTMNK